jgi:hypothetical protein
MIWAKMTLAILSTLVGTTPAETAFGHMINKTISDHRHDL